FVASYDPAGKLRWLKSGGGTGYDFGHSIELDGAGNCYVTGSLVGTSELAGAEVTNPAGAHAFLAKFSGAGQLAWLRASSGAGGNAGEHLAVDAVGNSVVVGGTSGVAKFGDVDLSTK